MLHNAETKQKIYSFKKTKKLVDKMINLRYIMSNKGYNIGSKGYKDVNAFLIRINDIET